MHSIYNYLSFFIPLIEVEPFLDDGICEQFDEYGNVIHSTTPEGIRQTCKKILESNLSFKDIMSAREFETDVLRKALDIFSNAIDIINEINHPTKISTKEKLRNRTSNKYLDRYIHSFEDTTEFYRNTNQHKQANELQDVIDIFKKMRNNPSDTMQELIANYILYQDLKDVEKHLNSTETFDKKNIQKLKEATYRRAVIYLFYFSGYDISTQDVYRDTMIKLYHLYYGWHNFKGRKEQTPKYHLEILFSHFWKENIKISHKKMSNIYLKGYIDQTPIFDYRNSSSKIDAFDHYVRTTINSNIFKENQFPEEELKAIAEYTRIQSLYGFTPPIFEKFQNKNTRSFFAYYSYFYRRDN